MSDFEPLTASFQGRFQVPGPVDEIFSLFSPQGERLWVSDWDPELLHPPGVDWCQGQIFRTKEEMGQAVWIVSRLDKQAHQVEYHRVERERYVAHIRVACSAAADGETGVVTSYAFIGLSEAGNREIELMTQRDYDLKMGRWAEWISQYLRHRGG